MKLKKNISFFLQRGPAYLLWIISFLMIRSKSKWCFGSQTGYASSNTKYLMREMVLHHPEIKVAWICDDNETYQLLSKNKIPVYKKWSLEGLLYCLTSKIYCYTHGPGDINFSTSGGSYKINLWHGVGVKNGEYLAQLSWVNRKNIIHRILYPYFCTWHNIIVVSSDAMCKLYCDEFREPQGVMLYAGLARSITAKMSEKELWQILNTTDHNVIQYIKKRKSYNRAFLYMPTYRECEFDVLTLSEFDLAQMNDVLKSKNDIMFLKFHPRDLYKLKGNESLSNIVFIKEKIDIYLFLPYISTLITDYSSIYAEYLLYNDEVIIFDFDIDDYMAKENGLYYDIKEFMSGVHAGSFKDLLHLIARHDHYKVPNLNDMMNKYWNRASNNKLSDKIISKLNDYH